MCVCVYCDVAMAVDCCSSPAPGYFNEDNTVDFLLHLNHGVHPNYDYSMVCSSLVFLVYA